MILVRVPSYFHATFNPLNMLHRFKQADDKSHLVLVASLLPSRYFMFSALFLFLFVVVAFLPEM